MHISNFLSVSRQQSIGLAYCSLDELADVEENYLGKMDRICEFCQNFSGRASVDNPALCFANENVSSLCGHNGAIVDNPALYFANENVSSLCCHNGAKLINPLGRVPLLEQIIRSDQTRPNYLENVRQLNNALAFASIGVRIEMPAGRGPQVFRIHGDIYHQLGALDPPGGRDPTYASLYIITPEKALDFRKARAENADIDEQLLKTLQGFLNAISPYARAFRHLHQVEQQEQL